MSLQRQVLAVLQSLPIGRMRFRLRLGNSRCDIARQLSIAAQYNDVARTSADPTLVRANGQRPP
jgi:hypothetical protein